MDIDIKSLAEIITKCEYLAIFVFYYICKPAIMDSYQIIKQYFPHLSERQTEQFAMLGDLYSQWNERINVISRKDIDNLYTHHVLHSLAIAKFLQPSPSTSILDLGTGGGFPGIPLAIALPNCTFHLIDRVGKKIKVAQNISETIDLTNVSFQHGDIAECKTKFDFVVSRGVMPLNQLVMLVRKNISQQHHNGFPNGVICLKGGDLKDELKLVKGDPLVDDLSTYFAEPFFETKKLIYLPLK